MTKMQKFSGFSGITKGKSKKDVAELIEENERLSQQMLRSEEDFRFQNETLLQEVNRLSIENEDLLKISSENEENVGSKQKENLKADIDSIMDKFLNSTNLNSQENACLDFREAITVLFFESGEKRSSTPNELDVVDGTKSGTDTP